MFSAEMPRPVPSRPRCAASLGSELPAAPGSLGSAATAGQCRGPGGGAETPLILIEGSRAGFTSVIKYPFLLLAGSAAFSKAVSQLTIKCFLDQALTADTFSFRNPHPSGFRAVFSPSRPLAGRAAPTHLSITLLTLRRDTWTPAPSLLRPVWLRLLLSGREH